MLTHSNRQQEIIQRVSLEYISKEAAHYHIKSCIFNGPGSMLAGRTASKILCSHQYLPFVNRIIQHKIFPGLALIIILITPVPEKVLAKSIPAGCFQKA